MSFSVLSIQELICIQKSNGANETQKPTRSFIQPVFNGNEMQNFLWNKHEPRNQEPTCGIGLPSVPDSDGRLKHSKTYLKHSKAY